MAIQIISVVVAVISAVAAVVSVALARKAVIVGERSNSIALIVGLHQLYHSESTFLATQRAWALYRHYQKATDGTPITDQQAQLFVKETDRFSDDWKAVHDATSFWRYLILLVNRGFVDEAVALRAFSSPAILGFLYPIEEAFVGKGKLQYQESLRSLYDCWKASSKRQSRAV